MHFSCNYINNFFCKNTCHNCEWSLWNMFESLDHFEADEIEVNVNITLSTFEHGSCLQASYWCWQWPALTTDYNGDSVYLFFLPGHPTLLSLYSDVNQLIKSYGTMLYFQLMIIFYGFPTKKRISLLCTEGWYQLYWLLTYMSEYTNIQG